jgi:hypothetical protein
MSVYARRRPMATLDPYVVCTNCGNRWPESDQATDWTIGRSKCCSRMLFREWDTPDQSHAGPISAAVVFSVFCTTVAILILWLA